MRIRYVLVFVLLHVANWPAAAAELVGTVVDADSGKPLPARVYVRAEGGPWRFVESTAKDGSALPYREQWVPMPDSEEKHTTISAHPFRIDLPPGSYTVTIERGKEFLSCSRTVVMTDKPRAETFRLKRWINMARRGWYSGETHVHRRIRELANVMQAEDLNVAFPVTFWTTEAFQAPGLAPSPLRQQGLSPFGPREDRGYQMITIDPTHVMFPRNTEYEIFSVGPKRHVLGAVFILNHRSVFTSGMPPVARLAEQAHREGALLDLDKHSWPWSMMLVPIARIDLYELSNNSVWRTQFGFRNSSVAPPEYMQVETDERGMTEWGWLQFGFENYYTLLNCGFRLQPTAGTASGVHPVPLGYSRVYVQLENGFSGPDWIDGLRRGHSFVTTGPMLFAHVGGQVAGHVFEQKNPQPHAYPVRVESISPGPIDRIEIVVNGKIRRTIHPGIDRPEIQNSDGAYTMRLESTIPIAQSSWIAIRSIQRQESGRVRFAHTAPWHIEVGGQPIRPRKEEVAFLIRRVREEIDRNQGVLPEEALQEYREALRVYRDLEFQE